MEQEDNNNVRFQKLENDLTDVKKITRELAAIEIKETKHQVANITAQLKDIQEQPRATTGATT